MLDSTTLISIIAIVVSGIVGVTGLILSNRRQQEESGLEQASRRTLALQMLSDEEFVLSKVAEECRSFKYIVEGRKTELRDSYENLLSVANRTIKEADDLLKSVRAKRIAVEPIVDKMPAAEIERIIASAYQGKMEAEAQLYRTKRSKGDTIEMYFK